MSLNNASSGGNGESTGDVENSGAENSRKRQRSYVWDHFEVQILEDGNRQVKCKHCSVSYKNPQGTSNMRKHYEKYHAEVSLSQTTLTNEGRINELLPLVGGAAEKITSQLVSTFVDASLPFSLVENEEFIKLIQILQPRYEVPS